MSAGPNSRLGVKSSDPGGISADPEADPEAIARAICLRLLAGAPKTRAQLAGALAGRRVPADAAQRVLDRFCEVGLIDDAAFAQAWVSSRRHGKGLSRSALAKELRARGVEDSVTASSLEALDTDDEKAAASSLVRRRLPTMGGLAPDVRVRRLVAMLARKGYSTGLAFTAVREVLAESGSESDGRDEVGAAKEAQSWPEFELEIGDP